jgi:hypothetical protein
VDWPIYVDPPLLSIDLSLEFWTIDFVRLAPDSQGAMREARFMDEQLFAIIREADREPLLAVAKRRGIDELSGG